MGKNLYISSLLDVYGEFLSEKQRNLTEHYYNEDLSLSEIAANEDISRQGVRDSIKRGENILTELEEQVGFAEKYRVLMDGISKIKTYAQNIAYYNSASYTTNDDIQKSAVDIMSIIDSLAEQEG